MSRVSDLSARFSALAALERHGIEVISVQDSLASRVDALARRIIDKARLDESDGWQDLVGGVKALRWRLITAPAPISLNPHIVESVEILSKLIGDLRGAVDDHVLLDELNRASKALLERDPRLGIILRDSLEEVGFGNAVVVAPSARSREAISRWLTPNCGRVMTLHELQREYISESIAYFVGPPRFFQSAAVTSPRTEEVFFITPAWFSDKRLPSSVFSSFAERPIEIAARVVEVEEVPGLQSSEPGFDAPEFVEDDLRPAPIWGAPQSPSRPQSSDEVEAHKVLLSGGFASWLDDDGDRIRALDPTQPPGERVVYVRVSDVGRGVFLLLREGQAERDALQARALSRIGDRSVDVRKSQARWKECLGQRIEELGPSNVEAQLRNVGVHAAGQVRAWCDLSFIRPQSDDDFRKLLAWLNLDPDPFFRNGTEFRLEVHRASRDLREELEVVADRTDLRQLEIRGHETLVTEERGLRGMFVARVIAVSPFSQFVGRADTRVPFKDDGGKWLE